MLVRHFIKIIVIILCINWFVWMPTVNCIRFCGPHDKILKNIKGFRYFVLARKTETEFSYCNFLIKELTFCVYIIQLIVS